VATRGTSRRQARWGPRALVCVRGTHCSRFALGGAQTPRQVGRRVVARAVSRGDAHSRVRIWAQLSGQRAFDWCFLQKKELDEIFTKNESCRVKYPLQQRAIGCLVKGLAGNVRCKTGSARLQLLFNLPLTKFLSLKSSNFEMPPIRKVVSLEKMYKFCIG
jgi:hypothetical protein